VLNGTASLILSGAPYNFKASMVGVSYVSPLIGVFLGAAYTGKFGDWFVVKLARRRNGIMESEYRLWLFCASLVLIPFGLILWGVGAAHHIHWFGLVSLPNLETFPVIYWKKCTNSSHRFSPCASSRSPTPLVSNSVSPTALTATETWLVRP